MKKRKKAWLIGLSVAVVMAVTLGVLLVIKPWSQPPPEVPTHVTVDEALKQEMLDRLAKVPEEPLTGAENAFDTKRLQKKNDLIQAYRQQVDGAVGKTLSQEEYLSFRGDLDRLIDDMWRWSCTLPLEKALVEEIEQRIYEAENDIVALHLEEGSERHTQTTAYLEQLTAIRDKLLQGELNFEEGRSKLSEVTLNAAKDLPNINERETNDCYILSWLNVYGEKGWTWKALRGVIGAPDEYAGVSPLSPALPAKAYYYINNQYRLEVVFNTTEEEAYFNSSSDIAGLYVVSRLTETRYPLADIEQRPVPYQGNRPYQLTHPENVKGGQDARYIYVYLDPVSNQYILIQ
ncbi:MAG: hypothetical protein E7541_03775 [Ruminococcaceae bacterium]|nr:hypothetical protein [Oscillospiraceae bacterium]